MTNKNKNNQLIVVMGVSGCGKSTLSKQLAQSMNYQLVEADDFHTEQAKQYMAMGQPLNDQMREPWISALCDHLIHLSRLKKNVVMAFSGLRRAHRDRIRSTSFETRFILLQGKYKDIESRLDLREDHFMQSSLLRSQFDSLQMPSDEKDTLQLDISATGDIIFAQALQAIEQKLD